jgi:hypothetical protein
MANRRTLRLWWWGASFCLSRRLVAPKQREGGRAPHPPASAIKLSQVVTDNQPAIPSLRIRFATCCSTEFVPVKGCATLAARCGGRAQPTHRIPQ